MKRASARSTTLSPTQPLYSRGFTIVELLVVVVIIAILAAVTIIAYNSMVARARAGQASAALSQAKRKLEVYKIDNGAYPTTVSFASAGIPDSDITYQYDSDGSTYCLTATAVNISYFLNSTSQASPSLGGCPGHGQGGAAAITNLVANPSFELNATGWGNYNSGGVIASSRQATGAAQGSAHYRLTWNSAATSKGGGCYPYDVGAGKLTAGKTYTFSMYVRSNVSQVVNQQVEWKDSALVRIGSAMYGNATTLSPNSWSRITTTLTAPTGTYAVTFPVYAGGTGHMWQVGEYLDCDGAMLVEGSHAYGYADGSSLNWIWNGVAHSSTSTGPAL